MFDVIIAGGGPAGLSAALLLGRCRRRVLVCDAGQPRNAATYAMYGFLTRNGFPPDEFLRIARDQLRPYHSVEVRDVEVTDAVRLDDRFEVVLGDGTRHAARKLLLATGVVDEVPQIEGMDAFYGRSVFHCPYCDGFEVRDQPLAIYGPGAPGRRLAFEMTAWSHDLVLCTDGPASLTDSELERLARHQIVVRQERITRLEGTGSRLERIVFDSGETLARRAMFFGTGHHQRSHLPEKLGCKLTPSGGVRTTNFEATTVPGLYVAGDATGLEHMAIVAAAEGAEAAVAINTAFLKEETA